jgi:hypothetical protein
VKSPDAATPSRPSTRPQLDCRGGATNEVAPESKEQIGGADPLFGRWALQLIEDQLTMLPEFVETSFECLEPP